MVPLPPKDLIPTAEPRVALVLGSGGLNALASLPLIEFLEAHQIHPELLVGCSGGAITLALWACGYQGHDMKAFSRHLHPALFTKNWRSIAIMFGLIRKGFNKSLSLFKTEPIFAALRNMYGDRRLEDLDPPLILQATDFETGEGVELDSGSLVEAVYASCAAYPFLHPVHLNGRWLFDGVFSAPLPILPAVRRGVDVVLAVDFSERLQPEPRSFFGAMIHVNKVLGRAVAQSQMLASIDLHPHEIIHIKVRFSGFTPIWETDAFERIQVAGRQAVAEYGAEILELVKGGGPPRPDRG